MVGRVCLCVCVRTWSGGAVVGGGGEGLNRGVAGL